MAYFATNKFVGDGVTTQFEVLLAGGYIDKSHIFAYIDNLTTRVRTPVAVTPAMFVGPNTINLGVSAPVGSAMVIYRDTPKSAPLVDFVNGSRITEANLDKVAQQGTFIGAEQADLTVDALLGSQEAAVSAEAARVSAVEAAASTTAAGEQAQNAAASAAAAATSYDAFDDRYLGAKATAPTLDNDGQLLLEGALYWDTTLQHMRVRTSGVWVAVGATTAGAVANIPAGTIAATTVQDALNELDAEKAKVGPLAASGITGAAASGANTDITSLSGLTAALSIAQGGTGATTADAAADAIGAFRRGTLLGTVSQSAGVPTGAVIERGSNANGEYVRYADGTQICWKKEAPISRAITTANGSVFIYPAGVTRTFPALFVAPPAVSISAASDNGLTWATGANPSSSSVAYYLIAGAATTQGCEESWTATGRWF